MKNLITGMAIFFSASAFAQENRIDLSLEIPVTKKPNSMYNSITLLDVREDTVRLGTVHNDYTREKDTVIPQISLRIQLDNLMSGVTDQTAAHGNLLLILQEFVMKPVKQRGYCYMKASLYANQDDMYAHLAELDTIKIVNTEDVTTGLLSAGRNILPKFIIDHLQSAPLASEKKFTVANLLNPDSIFKSTIPLYIADTLKDGLYKKYSSFKIQEPEITEFEPTFYKGNVRYLALKGKKGKFAEPLPDGYYAFVHKGHAYIISSMGFYTLEKRDNDFYFTGKYRAVKTKSDARIAFSISHAALAVVNPLAGLGGIADLIDPGRVVVSGPAMIDPENGEFITPKKKDEQRAGTLKQKHR